MPTLLSSLTPALIFLLVTAVSVLPFVPQVLRLVRTGDPTGLSPVALLAGMVNYAGWTVYLTDARAWSLLVTNLLAGVVWYAMAALALRRLPASPTCVLPLAWGAVLAYGYLHVPGSLGLLLGFGSLLTCLPQAVSAWTLPSLAGLSPATWVLCVVQGVVWFAMSLPEALVGGLIFGVVSTASALIVLLAMSVRGRGLPTPVGAIADVLLLQAPSPRPEDLREIA